MLYVEDLCSHLLLGFEEVFPLQMPMKLEVNAMTCVYQDVGYVDQSDNNEVYLYIYVYYVHN